MDVIIDVAFHSGERGLEKSFGPETVRGETLFCFLVDLDAHFFRVGPKDTDDEIFPDAMRPENPKRIGMRAGEKEIQLVDRHTGYFEGAHGAVSNLQTWRANVVRGFFL
jgi:hypothetical protein